MAGSNPDSDANQRSRLGVVIGLGDSLFAPPWGTSGIILLPRHWDLGQVAGP